jgi:hypothetical protein
MYPDSMSTPTSVRLIVVFNHRYEANLEKLDAIYRNRFPDIRYLMPFYQGSRPDVIRVYESSAQFQGYFAQAADKFIEPQVSHYAFVADDMLLNPEIDAGNLLERLGISGNQGCIENLNPLNNTSFEWPHLIGAIYNWQYERFTRYWREIPSPEEALRQMTHHGVKFADLTWRNLRGDHGWHRYEMWRAALKLMIRRKGRIKLPYPMVWTYADLVVVPRESVRRFCHLCGVFAAMGMWVEIAIPTALALTCDSITQLLLTGRKGRQIWSPAEVDELERKADRQVSRAFEVEGKHYLYIHPVKLSKWTVS